MRMLLLALVACPPSPIDCDTIEFQVSIGASLDPDGMTLIGSNTVLLDGALVYPVVVVGDWHCEGPLTCNICEGEATVTYPDGSEVTLPYQDASTGCDGLPPAYLVFPPWAVTTESGQSAQCQAGPCCVNWFSVMAWGVMPFGFGTASTAWPVKVVQPDVTGDGVVDVQDLVAVIVGWGTPDGDTGCDGVVDIHDLEAVIIDWGH